MSQPKEHEWINLLPLKLFHKLCAIVGALLFTIARLNCHTLSYIIISRMFFSDAISVQLAWSYLLDPICLVLFGPIRQVLFVESYWAPFDPTAQRSKRPKEMSRFSNPRLSVGDNQCNNGRLHAQTELSISKICFIWKMRALAFRLFTVFEGELGQRRSVFGV